MICLLVLAMAVWSVQSFLHHYPDQSRLLRSSRFDHYKGASYHHPRIKQGGRGLTATRIKGLSRIHGRSRTDSADIDGSSASISRRRGPRARRTNIGPLRALRQAVALMNSLLQVIFSAGDVFGSFTSGSKSSSSLSSSSSSSDRLAVVAADVALMPRGGAEKRIRRGRRNADNDEKAAAKNVEESREDEEEDDEEEERQSVGNRGK